MTRNNLDLMQSTFGGWIVKKTPHAPPVRLEDTDFQELQQAALADLSVSEHPDWQELRALTASWLVQRSRGKAPSPLGEEDFRTIVGIVQDPLSGSGIPDADETSSPPLSDDPYHYAREHLARCL